MAHSICGHYHIFSLRNCHRELPECLHHGDAGGAVHCAARVALPALQDANQTVRQRADPELDPSEGKMPGMRAADFTDVPECRTVDRLDFRDVLPGIWSDTRNIQVAVLQLLDHRADDYGSARAHSSRCGYLARLWGGVCGFRVPSPCVGRGAFSFLLVSAM